MRTHSLIIKVVLLFCFICCISCDNDSTTNPQPSGHTVTGRVLDTSGNGISGIIITLSGASKNYTGTTGSNGIYTINYVSEGMYIVSCSGDNYDFNISSKEISVDGVETIPTIFAYLLLEKGISFVSIPGGTFQMGNVENAIEGASDELPVHTVTLTGFEMSVCEITNAQYCAYLNAAQASGDIQVTSGDVYGKTGSWSGRRYLDIGYGSGQNMCRIIYSGGFYVTSGYANWPVVAVTWYGAKAFAAYNGMDLPTEAEWEYACRGGNQYKYGTDDGTISSTKANYQSTIGHPVDVGSYPANPFGLCDMSGNVWEWCHDWYGTYPSGSVTNPTGAQTGSSRAIHGGGSWLNYTGDCRSAHRNFNTPDYTDWGQGFRVIRRPGGVVY
jgi:formylglycine-generating enzyme required for sulfatase activity